MKLLICSLLALLIGAYGSFIGAQIRYHSKVVEMEAINLRLDAVMPNMIIARDHHQKAVDHPELYRHNVVANDDDGWVIIYQEIIDIGEAIKELLK